jgi:hypothetical protein
MRWLPPFISTILEAETDRDREGARSALLPQAGISARQFIDNYNLQTVGEGRASLTLGSASALVKASVSKVCFMFRVGSRLLRVVVVRESSHLCDSGLHRIACRRF